MNTEKALSQELARQPTTILAAINAIFKYFAEFGMPKLDPNDINVVVGLNDGSRVGVTCIPHDAVKTMIENPGGDPNMLPVLAQARVDIIAHHAQGATHGAILWAGDADENYFMWALGRVPIPDLTSKGGDT